MFNVTPIARNFLGTAYRRMTEAAEATEQSQRQLLAELLGQGARTDYGRRHGFAECRDYADFASRVPVVDYEDIRADVLRMVGGERDVLWPGRVDRYAQSSGTSGGKSKYIPLTRRSLHRCHYAGGTDVVASYLHRHPDSRLFAGRSFILGGSFASTLDAPAGVKVGDLSASLIECINPVANLFRLPSKDVALMSDWREKLPRLVEATAHADVTNLSGVPSWFMTVIEEVMKLRGAKELHEVWPNLEVFFHGGIAFEPYRERYNRLIDPARMRYVNTYNASEGFFAVQNDPADPAMLLLLDTDVFYEFESLSRPGVILPAWEVAVGEIYAMIITSSNGLWRYRLGDTVRIESRSPLKISIAGRTKSFINAFGEELMVYNADAALTRACRDTGAEVADYTAAPVYAANGRKGHHQWVVAFRTPPADTERFADLLDLYLTQENSDYEAKRSGDIFLSRLELTIVDHSLFDRWLASTGRLGGQRKIPRLSNDRHLVDQLLALR